MAGLASPMAALDFVIRVYLPDLTLIASFYPEWAALGEGVGNYLSYGDFPADSSNSPASLWLPSGAIFNRNLAAPPEPLDQGQIREYVARSWYSYTGGDGIGLHPSQGETAPNYTGPQQDYEYLNTETG